MPTLVGRQQIGRLRDISQRKYEEQAGIKWLQSIPETEGCEASMATAYEWNQPQLGRENTHKFNIHEYARVLEGNKPSKLQDQNVTNVLTGSNTSEISRAMKKISETNQLLAQQQMVQQRALQALLHHQEQSSEAQEVSQRIQSQALVALTEVEQQRGFDLLFNKIAKYNGKDPEKCHYWLNQVSMACMESGRNFRQSLMFCAEDAVLTVLSGLNPALTDDQIREEIMMCFSLALTRRQALERLMAMHQETDEQMWQYIVRHEVAHLRAHKLTADEQCSISEIMEFAMKLQPYIQDKLLKKIDRNRLPRNLCKAYDQAVDIECKNQITSRYGTSAQISQISEYDSNEGYQGIEAMELHLRDGNKFTTNRVNGAQRSFNTTNQGNFNKVGRPGGYVNRQNSGNNTQSNGRENFTFHNTQSNGRENFTFHSKYQDGPKPAKWDAQFQAYDIEGKAVLEALKKTNAFTILKENGPETEYSRKLAQYNPNLKAKFSPRQDQREVKQPGKDQTTAKKIAEAFSAVTGQEISEEEVSLIQDIQLPEEEMNGSNEDTEVSEVSEDK